MKIILSSDKLKMDYKLLTSGSFAPNMQISSERPDMGRMYGYINHFLNTKDINLDYWEADYTGINERLDIPDELWINSLRQ